MSDDILDVCYYFLKPERKSRSVLDIHTNFITKGYLLFTEDDLFKALTKDERFIVEDADQGVYLAQVKVACKKDK